jgi:hypothetical protein
VAFGARAGVVGDDRAASAARGDGGAVPVDAR